MMTETYLLILVVSHWTSRHFKLRGCVLRRHGSLVRVHISLSSPPPVASGTRECDGKEMLEQLQVQEPGDSHHNREYCWWCCYWRPGRCRCAVLRNRDGAV